MWRDLASTIASSWFGFALIAASVLMFMVQGALALLAMVEAVRQRRHSKLVDRLSLFEGDLAPPISILLPVRDEQLAIADRVRSLLRLRYPGFEIVVINDGSTDGTLASLVKAFGLRRARRTARARVPRNRVRGVYSSPDAPFLTVIDMVSGGRARALNTGLAYAHHPLFLAIDAGTVLERDTLIQLALPFYENTETLAVGGVVRPANGCVIRNGALMSSGVPHAILVRLQAVEQLRAMLAGWLGWNLIDSLYVVSGALGLFSRDAVLAVGGYRPATRGEEMDLVMRMQRWAGRRRRRLAVRFVANAVAWTEYPENPVALAKAQARAHRGLAESLWLNRELLLNTRFAFHHGLAFCFQVAVELLGPVVELLGMALTVWLAIAGNLQAPFAIIFLAVYVAGGTTLSLVGAMIERFACPRYHGGRAFESLAIAALLESFGYRQAIALFRVCGLVAALLFGGELDAYRRTTARIAADRAREAA